MKESARRKVRKGTHSCWECRRRKIRCKFENDADDVCIACRARGSPCLSQEFAPETAPPASDRRLSQRMSRLEDMVGRLVGEPRERQSVDMASLEERDEARVEDEDEPLPLPIKMPIPTPSESSSASPAHAVPPQCIHGTDSVDLLEGSAAGHARSIANQATGQGPCVGHIPRRRVQSLAKYAPVSHTLHGLFPPPLILQTLASQRCVVTDILSLFYTKKDCAEGKPDAPRVLASVPDPLTTHATLMAKRLLQLALCLQHHEGFDTAAKSLLTRENLQGRTVTETVHVWASSVSLLVASCDDLVTSQEGLEVLVLLSLCLADAGHLRRSWMAARRAMSIAQLMGVDRIRPWHKPSSRTPSFALRSVDPSADPSRHPSAITLWYVINSMDRCLSLPLGLAIGSHDDSFADESAMVDDSPEVRLNKAYIVIARRIADRNDMALAASSGCERHYQEQMQRQKLPGGPLETSIRPYSAEAYAATQVLDLELEKAGQMMNDLWWQIPEFQCTGAMTPCQTPASGQANPVGLGTSCESPIHPQSCALKLQIRHYGLLILVHLPYMLHTDKNQRYEYNRSTCLRASRAVLERFLSMRSVFKSPVSGRICDYTALMAGMTLLLGYRDKHDGNMGQDRDLLEAVTKVMHDMGVQHGDKLSQESAETLREMMPSTITSQAETFHWEPSQPFNQVEAFTESPAFSTPAVPGMGNMANLDVPMTDEYWGDMTVGSMDEWALQGVEATYWSMLNAGKTDGY